MRIDCDNKNNTLYVRSMIFPHKAILFDWAFTLVDLGEEDDRAALGKVFDRLNAEGIVLPDIEGFHRNFHYDFYNQIKVSRLTFREVCFADVLSSHFARHKIVLDGKITHKEILETYYKEIYSSRKLYPEVTGVLESLKGAGVKMGIVSNTTNPGFMKDYERKLMGMDSYFEFSIYSSEVIWRKPHPKIFHEAIGWMGFEPAEILFVGDNLEMDVKGASQVGMPSAWLNRNNSPLKNGIVPDYILKSFSDLLDIFPLQK